MVISDRAPRVVVWITREIGSKPATARVVLHRAGSAAVGARADRNASRTSHRRHSVAIYRPASIGWRQHIYTIAALNVDLVVIDLSVRRVVLEKNAIKAAASRRHSNYVPSQRHSLKRLQRYAGIPARVTHNSVSGIRNISVQVILGR